jgi:hypothetical protein
MDNLVRAIQTSFQRRNLGPFYVSYPAPRQIPNSSKKWPDSTGIGGRFETEWVSGLKRNHCPLSTGIYSYNIGKVKKTELPPILWTEKWGKEGAS